MCDIMLIAAVQIIIESLPISSSAHVILAQRLWLKITGTALAQVPDFFDAFIQGPTVLVLAVVFFKDWFSSIKRLFFSAIKLITGRSISWSEQKLLAIFGVIFVFVCAADSVTILAYIIKNLSVSSVTPLWILAVNFMILSIGLLSLKFIYFQDNERLTLKKSIILGLTQGLALLCPGLSRFGSTYVVGRWLRLSPRRSFQFSFLIQFPLIFAAFVINGLPAIFKIPAARALFTPSLILTIICSTIIAGLLFAWSYRLALCRKFWVFGVYIIVPVTVLVLLYIKS